ncbi:plastocyanin/azurin family copper-binding protein [Halogeometricum sp. S1BR25-6]|uniref:Plastocyanin/azurin family copper-binding protein n=1 Tax=Halogeometricum salsisoli TaxID=2950536 RepID=A0ABU2GCD4_9EURY|nr:plastocyanin/azurin family copper-binding protein [Halogeometricum sp. S1BR25-6]MDS0298466.1 plastocyanin/azurin family copper-binding protein [Halogeometricum sp. S1BR25-6]
MDEAERNRAAEGVSRRRVLAGAGSVAAAGLAGCLSSAEGDYDVGMTAVAFDPPSVTVSVGEEVVWRNTSSRGHTVTAYGDEIPDDADFFASGGYESEQAAREAYNQNVGGLIDSGQNYSHTFEVPGEYRYLCVPHESQGMVGTIVVEEGSESGGDGATSTSAASE